MANSQNFDVVIAGAGIIGLNIAFQTARRSSLKVLVLDKGQGPGEGSTGASSAVCRFRYSRAETVELARNGIAAYRNWQDYTGLAAPRAHFHQQGMLWLEARPKVEIEAEKNRLSALGVAVQILDDYQLEQHFPSINPCLVAPDLTMGEEHECKGAGHHLFETEAGYVDPVDALQDMLDACRNVGVEVRFRSNVDKVEVEGGRIAGVRQADGSAIGCSVLVNAAGPWCSALSRMAGLEVGWLLEPTRIQVVHIDRPPDLWGEIPITCDVPGGIYFRTQNRGQQLIVGSILEQDERETVTDPDDFARYVDDDYARSKLHALEHRLPGLKLMNVRGYSGLYTINRADVHPLVGESEIGGFFLANGCSGHGFKLAPAIGALLGRQLTGTELPSDPSVGADFLAVNRKAIDLSSKSVLA